MNGGTLQAGVTAFVITHAMKVQDVIELRGPKRRACTARSRRRCCIMHTQHASTDGVF